MAVTLTTRTGEGVSGEIPFHKHCQKTVLSASGKNGSGKTWGEISNLGNLLTNLPNNWIDDFFKPNTNMTQDLAGILRLINWVSGRVGGSNGINQVSFYDMDGNIIGNPYIPDMYGNISPKLGRKIRLMIEGQEISFATIAGSSYNSGDEITSITLPKHKLRFIENDAIVDQVDVVMDSDISISIPSDLNLVHKTGNETIAGNKTFTGATTLKGTITTLDASPPPTADGHEVIDAAWVKQVRQTKDPSVVHVYVSSTGNDASDGTTVDKAKKGTKFRFRFFKMYYTSSGTDSRINKIASAEKESISWKDSGWVPVVREYKLYYSDSKFKVQ